MNKNSYTLLNLEQPIGNFGLTVMCIYDIINIAKISRRTDDAIHGIQRKLIPDRVKKIAQFVDENPNKIAFPTPIILSLPDLIENESESKPSYYSIENGSDNQFSVLNIMDNENSFANVIDGQHRIEGIKSSASYKNSSLKLSLPVLFVIEASVATSAYLFSTINGNQRPVPYSFIADLFELQTDKSITKSSHKITVDINTLHQSPLQGRIKMLGIKTSPIEKITQGTIVRILEKLLSKEPFKKYYDNDEEVIISKILINMFTAIQNTWQRDWPSEESTILKSAAFHGFMEALPCLYKIGKEKNTLTQEFFYENFQKAKQRMDSSESINISDGLYFTSQNFSSNLQGSRKLKDFITI